MFFRRFRLSAGHLKKVLPGFSTAQDSTSSLIAVGLLSLCGLMQDFTEQPHLDRYTLFIQDYGGPVGFRMALAHPERIQAILSRMPSRTKRASLLFGQFGGHSRRTAAIQ